MHAAPCRVCDGAGDCGRRIENGHLAGALCAEGTDGRRTFIEVDLDRHSIQCEWDAIGLEAVLPDTAVLADGMLFMQRIAQPLRNPALDLPVDGTRVRAPRPTPAMTLGSSAFPHGRYPSASTATRQSWTLKMENRHGIDDMALLQPGMAGTPGLVNEPLPTTGPSTSWRR